MHDSAEMILARQTQFHFELFLNNKTYMLNKLKQLDVTLWKFLLLNMFRMLLHSSSGGGDCM